MRTAFHRLSSLLVGGAVVLIIGCENKAPVQETPAPAAPTEEDRAAVRQMTNSDQLPPGHPPIDPASGGAMMPPPPNAAPTESELKFTAPEKWESQPPANAMRRGQYVVPQAEGDPENGEVVVFHFPGTGGAVDANIDRWVGQFATEDGKPVDPATIQRETFEVNGLKVHLVEVTGFYTNSMAPGGGSRSPQPYKLLGGIVETPSGGWFFKGTGPIPTMDAAREDFLTMLKSAHL